MKKIIICTIGFFAISCTFYGFTQMMKNKIVNSESATWTEHYNNIEDLSDNSDFIVQGKVVSTYTELREDMVFTLNQVVITNVISGKLNEGEKIEILQTGGCYSNISTAPFEEAPLLNKNESYLLYLEHTKYDEKYGQYYLIIGGYQGYAEIDTKTNEIEAVNNKNEIFKNENFSIDEIENIAREVN